MKLMLKQQAFHTRNNSLEVLEKEDYHSLKLSLYGMVL